MRRNIARFLAGYILAEVDKNEISAEATAALYYVPGVLTVKEIGVRERRRIIIRDGMSSI